MQLPAINQNVCGQWSEQDVNTYNKYPFYFVKAESEFRTFWPSWAKDFAKIPWKPNMGDTMRRIMTERSPVMRQETYPNLLSSAPLTDVVAFRERTSNTQLRWQDFESPPLYFLPNFQDFNQHVMAAKENVDYQSSVFTDQFYETMIFHNSPYVYVCGYGLIPAPTGTPNSTGTAAKTNAWLAAEVMTPLMGSTAGFFTIPEAFKMLQIASNQLGMTPYAGTDIPKDNEGSARERYKIKIHSSAFDNLINDEWLKEQRPLAMNVVTDALKGEILGRIISSFMKFPRRYMLDNQNSPSQAVPEVSEENPNREDYGQTIPNPLYADPDNSPIEVGYLIGGKSYEVVNVGPPPADFVRKLDSSTVATMNWNGKANLTTDLLVPCVVGAGGGAGGAAAGSIVYKTNSRGRYLKVESTVNLAISSINARNVLPFIYKRRSGLTTATNT